METEKLISLLCGDQFMNTKVLPEYDIPSLEMSDGPMGLRYQKKDKDSLGINRSEPATNIKFRNRQWPHLYRDFFRE